MDDRSSVQDPLQPLLSRLRARPGVVICVLLVTTLISILGHGCDGGGVNHTYQFPLILKAAYPDLYPTDALVATLDTYAAPIYRLLGYIVRATGIGLHPLHLLLFLLTNGLMVAGISLIVARFVRTIRWWAVATLASSASPWMWEQSWLGDVQVLSGQFSHTSLALALAVAALAMLLHRRPLSAALLLSVAFWCNAVTTLLAVPIMLVWLALEGRLLTRPTFIGAGIFAASALPLLRSVAAKSGPGSETFREFLPVVYDCHFWIDAPSLTLELIPILLAAAIAAVSPSRDLRRLIAAVLVVVAAFVAVNWLGVYVLELRPIVLLHPQRADIWVFLLIPLGLPVLAARSLESGRSGAAPLWIVVLLLQLQHVGPSASMALLSVVLILIASHLDERGPSATCRLGRWQPTALIAAAVAIAVGAALLALSPYGLFPAAALMLSALLAFMADPHRYPHAASRYAVGVIIIGVLLDFGQMDREWYQTSPRGGYAQAAQWARYHTPTEAEFFVAPAVEGWRSASRRSSFVHLRDGSAMLWSEGFEKEWWRRLQALNCDYSVEVPTRRKLTMESYKGLTPRMLLAVADDFGYGDYVVMPDDWPDAPSITPEFTADGVSVYSLDRLRAATQPLPGG